jgi:quaternary ammonium compound-resistance protein SugE
VRVRFVTASENRKKKGVKDAVIEKEKQVKEEARRQFDSAMQQVKKPGKLRRVERYAVTQLPVHPQYIEAGTADARWSRPQWAIGLKYTEGSTRLWPRVWTVLAMIISLGLLGIAMKTLPVGTAYSVWVGAVGTVVLGIVLLGESASLARMISVALIVAGIVGLKLSTH